MLDYVTPPFRLSLNRAAARWRFWTALALALPLATLAVLDYGVSGTSLQPADAPLLTILAAIVVLLAAYAAVAAFQAFGDAPSTRIDPARLPRPDQARLKEALRALEAIPMLLRDALG